VSTNLPLATESLKDAIRVKQSIFLPPTVEDTLGTMCGPLIETRCVIQLF